MYATRSSSGGKKPRNTVNRHNLLEFDLRWEHDSLRRERIRQRKVPCRKVPYEAGDCFARGLGGIAAFTEKFERDTIEDNAKVGIGLEKVTIVHGIQHLVERVLDPELTVPGGILLRVRESRLRGFFDKRL